MTEPQCNHQHAAVLQPRPLQAPESDLVAEMLSSIARPDAVVEDVIAGPKFIAVTADGRMGLASLLGARPTSEEKRIMARAVGQMAADIAGYLRSPSPFSISLGLAALNAGNAPDPETISGDGASAEALIARLGRGRQVGVVGQFPFVDRLRAQTAALHLFELRDAPGAVDRSEWEATLVGVEVLALTGTALLTRRMAWFLAQAKQAEIVVLGPTTPLSRALFRFGADHLCGSVATDPERAREGVRTGDSFRAIKKAGGIRFVHLSR